MTRIFARLCGWTAVVGVLAAMAGAVGPAVAQGPVGYGDWQLHLPTNRPLRLADAGDRLYVATENAFYFLDKALNATQTLSSRDGLSGVRVAALAYDSVRRQTVVVYRNGNIDIIGANGRVRNMNDILRANITGNRDINDVYVDARPGVRRAFISTDFGVVVLNLDRLEISDTYAAIGPNGARVRVLAATTANDSLFVATAQGLQVGRLGTNLLDYQNWTRPVAQPVAVPTADTSNYQNLATFGGRVYAGVNGGDLFRYSRIANQWLPVPGYYSRQFRRLRPTAVGLLVVADGYGVRAHTGAGNGAVVLAPATANDVVRDVVRTRDGGFYVANFLAGLQRVPPTAGAAREAYQANGPETARAFGLLADARSGVVNVFTGGFSDRFGPSYDRFGFYEYRDNRWANATSLVLTAAEYPNPAGPVRGTRTPDGTLYVANHGGGLLEWKGPGQFRVFNNRNSPLPNFGNFGGNTDVRLNDVAAAADGTLWVAERHLIANLSGLFRLDPRTTPPTWTQVPYFDGGQSLDRLALDDAGQVWATAVRRDGPGLWVVDGTSFQNRRFTSANGLPSDDIYSIAKDRKGDIWVATGKGVAVFNDPASALGGTGSFRSPLVRRGAAADFPALYSEVVRAVAVDGANRKWFGTDNGLWLFSEDADEALLHFTTANSPLPGNRIQDVAVNDKTGDVWVATDAGVVSYRSAASVTPGTPSCAQVFPNPVPVDFGGLAGVTGLANNALVKITDVAGHLVYATKATGGGLTWNLNDALGNRVKPGVYLVLSSDADGKNSCVSKVVVK